MILFVLKVIFWIIAACSYLFVGYVVMEWVDGSGDLSYLIPNNMFGLGAYITLWPFFVFVLAAVCLLLFICDVLFGDDSPVNIGNLAVSLYRAVIRFAKWLWRFLNFETEPKLKEPEKKEKNEDVPEAKGTH